MQLTWDVINVFWTAHFSVDEMMNKWSQHHFPVPNSYKLMNPHTTYASRKTLSVAHPVLKHTGTLWSNLETRWKAPGHQLFYVIKSNVYTLSTYHFVNSHADHPGKKERIPNRYHNTPLGNLSGRNMYQVKGLLASDNHLRIKKRQPIEKRDLILCLIPPFSVCSWNSISQYESK